MQRTAFGRRVAELRLARQMSQTEFARRANMSVARVSHLEHQRSHINEDVVRVYLDVLQCNGNEAHELRKLAQFSNNLRDHSESPPGISPLQAMLKQFGDAISPAGRARIQKVLEEETGEMVASLRFSSNQSKSPITESRSKKRRPRPSLWPDRLAEIALMAEGVRRQVAGEMQRVSVGLLLDRLAVVEPDFDYLIQEDLPAFAEGAFALITGHSAGHTLHLEESRFKAAVGGQVFGRHAIAHEIGHHFLHTDLLRSERELFLPPQELAKNRADSAEESFQIEQVVDSLVEEEAECFAVFLLVPWTAFLKGTAPFHLAKDYGEQDRAVERYGRYFKNPAVLDAFRGILWKLGQKEHIIFTMP